MNMADCLSPTPRHVGWPMADTKVIQKSAIGHMTLVGQLTLSAGLTIHV